MGQLPFVSEVTRYLDGFLAAARPGHGGVDLPAVLPSVAPPEPAASAPPEPAPENALPAGEQIKRDGHPLDAFPRLLACAAMNRPPAVEDQFRFRWFGLFYQAPRQDAFRLRLRLPGGRLQGFQCAGLSEITQSGAAGEVVLNAQGGLDVPGVPVPMAAEVLRAVEQIGLSARQTGGDCVQCVRGGEGDEGEGVRAGTVYALVGQLEQALAHSRRLADLPGPCEILFTTAGEGRPIPGDDGPGRIVFQATEPRDPPGFLLTVPGGSARGWHVPAARVVSGCLQLLEAWATDGDRAQPPTASLAAFHRSLSSEQMGAWFDRGGWQEKPHRSGVSLASASADALPGLPLPDGRLLSGQLRRIAEALRAQGASEIRLARGGLHLAPGTDPRVYAALAAALAS